MADYMKSTPEGLSVVDFSGLTRDQTAALSQVTVEDVACGKRVPSAHRSLTDVGSKLW
jgi:phage terminase small subunit